jgi:anti-sigma-K factor RskA
MSNLSRNEVEELIGAYALDAVDGDERAAIERLIEDEPDLRAELDSYRKIAAVLAEAVDPRPSTPSPKVWQGIKASISTASATDAMPLPLSPTRELRRQRWFSWAATAVSVAAITVAVGLGVRVANLQQQVDETPSGSVLEAALEAAIASPGATLATMQSPADAAAARASVVVGADGVGYVYADTLPALSTDRTYQLWAIVDGTVISAGVMGADPGISPFHVVGNIDGFAITEEAAGGVISSANDPVAVWLDA